MSIGIACIHIIVVIFPVVCPCVIRRVNIYAVNFTSIDINQKYRHKSKILDFPTSKRYNVAVKLNKSRHLDSINKIILGSFYTPRFYVTLAKKWMQKHSIIDYTVLDTSAGYGAFFEIEKDFPASKFIANDIDIVAIQTLKQNFPLVVAYNKNALCNITRDMFDITEKEKLIIVGNPPYNDVTSQIRKRIKSKTNLQVDKSVKSRDLGLCFVKSYNILKADYALILHPLSYLIKEANFNRAKSFFSNYIIKEHIVFSSSRFEGTSLLSSFPIIMALYKRCENNGLTYKNIFNMTFCTEEKSSFCLAKRDYIGNYIPKYPNKGRYTPDIMFYTMRDINALKRSRTFIKEDTANAIHIKPELLPYYCYVDCFKEYIKQNSIPYFMGNLDIPFIKDSFEAVKDDCVFLSKERHKDIFCNINTTNNVNSFGAKDRVNKYIKKVISF